MSGISERRVPGYKPFDGVVAELIRRGIRIIDYRPHRRRAGKRSSRPPY